jgi:hypothetical protein
MIFGKNPNEGGRPAALNKSRDSVRIWVGGFENVLYIEVILLILASVMMPMRIVE